jgi:hypothetical protein
MYHHLFSSATFTALLNSNPLFHSTNQLHHIQCLAHTLPYIMLTKTIKKYTLNLKMVTAIFAKTSDNSHIRHEFGSEKLRKRMIFHNKATVTLEVTERG